MKLKAEQEAKAKLKELSTVSGHPDYDDEMQGGEWIT
jgi:hypothetical protein